LPGASGVSLETIAKPNTARLVVENDPPIIPAASAGSGVEGALAAVGDIANRIRALPIEEIAGNLRSTSRRLNTLVNDPALDRSLRSLDSSLAEVEKNVGPIANSLRRTATSVEKTAATAAENVGPIVDSLR